MPLCARGAVGPVERGRVPICCVQAFEGAGFPLALVYFVDAEPDIESLQPNAPIRYAQSHEEGT